MHICSIKIQPACASFMLAVLENWNACEPSGMKRGSQHVEKLPCCFSAGPPSRQPGMQRWQNWLQPAGWPCPQTWLRPVLMPLGEQSVMALESGQQQHGYVKGLSPQLVMVPWNSHNGHVEHSAVCQAQLGRIEGYFSNLKKLFHGFKIFVHAEGQRRAGFCALGLGHVDACLPELCWCLPTWACTIRGTS